MKSYVYRHTQLHDDDDDDDGEASECKNISIISRLVCCSLFLSTYSSYVSQLRSYLHVLTACLGVFDLASDP